MEVIIQCIIGKVHNNNIEYVLKEFNSYNQNPDDQVIAYIKTLSLLNIKEYIIHSTSWHWEPNKIILTYLIVIPIKEPINLTGQIDITTKELAYGESIYKPRPLNLKNENIIRHAFRHLAYLIKHDYKNIYKDVFSEDQKNYILSVYDEVAEEITTIA